MKDARLRDGRRDMEQMTKTGEKKRRKLTSSIDGRRRAIGLVGGFVSGWWRLWGGRYVDGTDEHNTRRMAQGGGVQKTHWCVQSADLHPRHRTRINTALTFGGRVWRVDETVLELCRGGRWRGEQVQGDEGLGTKRLNCPCVWGGCAGCGWIEP